MQLNRKIVLKYSFIFNYTSFGPIPTTVSVWVLLMFFRYTPYLSTLTDFNLFK